jgi:hypothetical protein
MTNRTVIRFGGVCLAGGALAFMGLFASIVINGVPVSVQEIKRRAQAGIRE